MLIEAGIITVGGVVVSLTEGWIEALERARELGGEIEVAERDRTRYRIQSEAFRNRKATKPSHHYVNAGADGHIEELHPADTEPKAAPSGPVVSQLAQAIRDYLERNPHDACQPPGWLGTTLWAYDLYQGKPTPAEVKGAIRKLGGERWLMERLDAARRAASEGVA